MADIFDTLCGESGVVNQINDAQDQIREVVTAGKNAISQVKQFANDLENLQDAIENQPGVVTRRLQEDLKNLLSEEALRDPAGTIAKLLAIAAARCSSSHNPRSFRTNHQKSRRRTTSPRRSDSRTSRSFQDFLHGRSPRLLRRPVDSPVVNLARVMQTRRR